MVDQNHIGQGLKASGLVDDAQLQGALLESEQTGRALGEVLIEKGLLSESQFTQFVSKLLSVPWVSLYHVQFTRELLNLIPAQLAERHCLVPVYTRVGRKGNAMLYVATQDPSDVEALEEVRQLTRMDVKPMIAPPSEIRRAIGVYYFGRSPNEVSQPSAIAEASASSKASSKEILLSRGWSAPPKAAPMQSAAAQGDGKAEAASDDVKMITVTLLDGTSVKLPAAKGSSVRARQTNDSLTATDLIEALSAQAQGADVSEILPEVRWERFFGSLLTLLMRKGLIADWEFVDEWKKHR